MGTPTGRAGAPGRLPASAQARLDALRSGSSNLQTSYLSAASATSLTATGFAPVGDVMGCATTQISYAYLGSCGGFRGGSDPQVRVGAPRLTGGSGSYRQRLRNLYATALRRLTDEAVAMGADGVVGISLTIAVHDLIHEVVAVGTGVRAMSARPLPRRPDRPFTTDLSGTDLAKLLLGGWAPVSLHVAAEVGLVHDAYRYAAASPWGTGSVNLEIPSWTQLLQATTAGVRSTLTVQVAATGAEGCLLSSLSTRKRRTECPRYGNASDLVALSVAVGTSITRFAERRSTPRTLSIMPVNTRGGRR